MKCEICGRTFKSKRGLAIHKGKLHKDDKPLLVKIHENILELINLLRIQRGQPPLNLPKRLFISTPGPKPHPKYELLFEELKEVLKERGKTE